MAAREGRPFTSPVLVGRAMQLATLLDTLEQAAAGRGQTVLVSGEAGIGKSRLVAEARRHAVERGYLVLQGACFEHDRVLPYAPLLDLLRLFLAGRPPEQATRALEAMSAELAALLPELGPRRLDAAPRATLGPEEERQRLFEALVQLFLRLAAIQPLFVVAEDLHWSDETSLDVFHLLSRRLSAQPVLLVLTYRDDEMGAGLARLLGELDRERMAVEITLRRLDRGEVAALVAALLHHARPAPAQIVEQLWLLSEGNPFFVEELARSLLGADGGVLGDGFSSGPRSTAEPAEGGWERGLPRELRVPRSVAALVQRRSAQLGPAARELLALAAVAGRRFDFALLQSLTGRDEAELLRVIKELIAAQLVVEESADRFAFRHALTRAAVLSGLLARERQALHRVIAATLEHLAADGHEVPVGDLAEHHFEAGAWARALEYSTRAGEQARALYAPRAAVEHFDRALEAAERLGVALPPAVYRARGLAHETLGEFERARADHEAAAAQARATGDRRAEWQAQLDLGLLWASRDYQHAGLHLREALALARAMDEPSAMAHSLNRLGNWYVNREQPLEALPLHEEALAIFRAAGDRPAVAETLDLLGMASAVGADVPRAHAALQEASALFRALGHCPGLASSLANLVPFAGTYETESIAVVTPFSAGLEAADEALALARQIGWRAGEVYALIQSTLVRGPRGDYEAALAAGRQCLALAEEIGHRQWLGGAHYALGVLWLDLLGLDTARRHLEQALALSTEVGSAVWWRVAASALASACVEAHDPGRAEEVLSPALGPATPPWTLAQRGCWLAWARLALTRGEAGRALEVAERLLEAAPGASAAPVIPQVLALRGEALMLLQRTAEAEAALRLARDQAHSAGLLPLAWRVRVALGRLLRAARRYDAAEQELEAARVTVDGLAARLADPAAREALLQGAATRLPTLRPRSPRRAAREAFGGLTGREREVAALIAAGKTNREIAAALVVSQFTVATYVSSILMKLGFTSRAQVAAWASAKGLARPG